MDQFANFLLSKQSSNYSYFKNDDNHDDLYEDDDGADDNYDQFEQRIESHYQRQIDQANNPNA
jgi:hypothetical protein